MGTRAGLVCVGERKVFKRGEYMTVYKLVAGRELGQGADSESVLRCLHDTKGLMRRTLRI